MTTRELKQELSNTLFIIRLYTRDNTCEDSNERINVLNDKVDYLRCELGKSEKERKPRGVSHKSKCGA